MILWSTFYKVWHLSLMVLHLLLWLLSFPKVDIENKLILFSLNQLITYQPWCVPRGGRTCYRNGKSNVAVMLDKKHCFPMHLKIFLIYSDYLSTTTGSFVSRALFQSLSSLAFISHHFQSEAYVWQTYAQEFGCQMSESLPTIKVSYKFRRKKNGCCSNFTKRKEDKLSLADR